MKGSRLVFEVLITQPSGQFSNIKMPTVLMTGILHFEHITTLPPLASFFLVKLEITKPSLSKYKRLLLSSSRPYQLYGYHEDGLEGEGAVTEVKQVL